MINRDCKWCNKSIPANGHPRHEKFCYLNPTNKRLCQICNSPIKNWQVKKQVTCGYACSNKLFRTGTNNGNWSDDCYRSTCFLYHKKECIICGENLIVEVHHMDENKLNNHPSNLVPLCPTHHQYWHSRHRYLIQEKVELVVSAWQDSNLRFS